MQGLRAGIVGVVVAACVLASTTAGAVTAPPKVAYFYGDSLTYEAAPTLFAKLGRGWDAHVFAFPTLGACVIRRQMEADLPGKHVDRVTIESYGNNIGDCYTPAQTVAGSAENLAKWREDLHAMFTVARAASARVTYIAPPPDYARQAFELQLTAIAVQEAAVTGVRVNYGPRNSVGGKVWRATMPCKPIETPAMGCTGGQIVVRAPDRLHFCPSGFAFVCPTYSGGAFRFGAAMAAATKAV